MKQHNENGMSEYRFRDIGFGFVPINKMVIEANRSSAWTVKLHNHSPVEVNGFVLILLSMEAMS